MNAPTSRFLPAAGLLLGIFLITGCSATVEDERSKTFTVAPGGKLVIDADRGSIDILPGGDDKLAIRVHRKVTSSSESRAREVLEAHEVTFHQDGDTVSVRARSTKTWERLGWWGHGFGVRYEITMPRRFNVDLKTAGGSIAIEELTGEVRAHTSGGSLKFGVIDGPVTCKTAGGSIRIASAAGVLDAHTSGGSITVDEAQAPTTLGTAGGSIRVKEARAALKVGTSGGSIELGEVGAAVEATTSGGSIRAGFVHAPESNCRLETSGGSVRVTLPEGANLNVDARTSGGHVTCDLPVTVQGEVKRNQLVGKLGSGGPLLQLRTSGGSISIQKN